MSTEKRLVFICYRSTDSGESAGILYEQLSKEWPSDRLFLAPESIGGGEEWPSIITTALDDAVVMIVLIGREWLRLLNEHGQRFLDQPGDWVVREICVAIEREIPIIPVLVDGAELPSKEALPSDIKELSEKQTLRIRRGASQKLEEEDVEKLRRDLEMSLSPIKGRHSYQEGDRVIFKCLQRDRELGECLKALRHHERRVGVLSGSIGCGQSSFIKAGIMPALNGPKTNSPTGIYIRFTREDPFSTLLRHFQYHLQLGLSGRDLPSWFDQVAAVAATRHSSVVLVFDQFEEVLHGEQGIRAKVVDGLKHWYERQLALPLKILFCVHSEASRKSLCDDMKCSDYDEFNLRCFSAGQALDVLEALAKASRMTFKRNFVKENVIPELDTKPDGILPLTLQIVASAFQHGGEGHGFTEKGYTAIHGIQGIVDRYLSEELEGLPERDEHTVILGSLIDWKIRRGCSLPIDEVFEKLRNKMSRDDIEQKLKKLAEVGLVWSEKRKGISFYELTFKYPIGQVIKDPDKWPDVWLANRIINHHVQNPRNDDDLQRLKLQDFRLIKKIISQGKIQWSTQQSEKKKQNQIIEKSRRFAFRVRVGSVILIGLLVFFLLPKSGKSEAENLLTKAIEIPPKANEIPGLPVETLAKVIAALGKWEEWEKWKGLYPESKADRGRSELSLLAGNQKEWKVAEGFATDIRNSELKALVLTRLAEELQGPDDQEIQNGFVQSARRAVRDMPEEERAERVHVLKYIQRRMTNSDRSKEITDDLAREARSALIQIGKHINGNKLASPKDSSQEDVPLREQVRLLALAAVVESYADEQKMMREKLEAAKAILATIKDDHDKSIAFHVLIQGMGTCVVADRRDDSFYTMYFETLVKLLPTSTSSREHILGLIEASAIILRAAPPAAAEKLASEFLDKAEKLASSLGGDHDNKTQASEQPGQSSASFLLREVRTVTLAHAKILGKYMVKRDQPKDMDHDNNQPEPSIELIRKIIDRIKVEWKRKENLDSDRLDLLLTLLASARILAEMDNLDDVKKALENARTYAEGLRNPHQRSAILRDIVEIATGVDTRVRTNNALSDPTKKLEGFIQEVLSHESLDLDDKGWATASYAIALAQKANETHNATEAFYQNLARGLRRLPILGNRLGGCADNSEFTKSIKRANLSTVRDYALHGVAREMAKAGYLKCAHEQLEGVSDNITKTSGYAAMLLPHRADIPLPKGGVLAISAQVSPDQDGSRSKDAIALMRLVPGGYFVMGVANRDIDQSPQRHVDLNAFYIDAHEVTVEQYRLFYKQYAKVTELKPNEWSDGADPSREKKPVVSVNYKQAALYCEWADKRLPTEAEWEKAARGTDGRIYPWGNDLPTTYRANYDKLSWDDYQAPEAVNKNEFEEGKSPYGVYHMSGNVWEWVEDWYGASSYIHSVPDPHGPPGGNWRVLRGGAWDNNGKTDTRRLEATFRLYKDPPYYYYTIGFRCVR